MHRLGFILIPVLMVMFVACGSDDDDGGDDATTTPTAAATSDASSGGSGSSSGSSSGSGSSSSGGRVSGNDIAKLVEDLTPPNSSEVARFSAADGINVSYQSTDSVDDLKSYYDDKIDDLGLAVAGTFDAEGTHTWILADDDDDNFSGSLSLGSDGDNSIVILIIGTS